MSWLAVIRPDDWNLALLAHVTGAMVLVGALATAVAALVASRSDPSAPLKRVAFRTLLLVAVPAYLLMRVAAEWILSEEDVDDEAAWVGIGYIVSDLGLLLLIVATVLAGITARRAKGGGADSGRLARVSVGLMSVMLAGYAVAVWAMTTKPE